MSKGVVCGVGRNDMYWGWTKANDWNQRVYVVWTKMIQRCYSEKYHEKNPTYIGCFVCSRWLKLSNFVEDIVKIPNYEYWRDNPKQGISLDKDIKSNGKNKEYSLEQCQFTDFGENARQAMKTRDYVQGENNPNHGQLVAQINPSTDKIINLKYNREYIELGFNQGNISSCCRGRYKTSQGFIWKYLSDCTPEQIKEYYESLE